MMFGRYIRFWLSLAKFSLLGEMAFRGNFLVKIFVELLWLGILLLFNFTIFQVTSQIADWNIDQYLFFVGLLLRDGRADRERCFSTTATSSPTSSARAISISFCSSRSTNSSSSAANNIDWSCMPNVLLGFCVMGYALWVRRLEFNPLQLLLFLILFASGGGAGVWLTCCS